ncbi:MAG TPA: biotin--[acetyl-CoA-carboxylase] ligase, partial [Solirubrobacterales bacterium]|nr:biotin--[acetyl-CoA-carboxylase] ligase [Solirubrobacterales bacterium]
TASSKPCSRMPHSDPQVMSFGEPHEHHERLESTNTRARELAAAGAPHGTVVTAGEQTAGRGRQGRSWVAPPGKALLYSAIVRPLEERHMMLPLAAPLAVCGAAEELRPDIACQVKWPNDIWLDARKLAGVLIEARPQDGWAVIGVGLNLTITSDEFPADLRTTAVSLFDSTGGDMGKSRRSLPAVATAGLPHVPANATAVLSNHLSRWTEQDPETVLAEWRRRDALKGREISWDAGSGIADGVDERGYLLVRLADGDRVALGAGEVHLRL